MATKKKTSKGKSGGSKGTQILAVVLGVGGGIGAGFGSRALNNVKFLASDKPKNYKPAIVKGTASALLMVPGMLFENPIVQAISISTSAVFANDAVLSATNASKGTSGLGNADPLNLYTTTDMAGVSEDFALNGGSNESGSFTIK